MHSLLYKADFNLSVGHMTKSRALITPEYKGVAVTGGVAPIYDLRHHGSGRAKQAIKTGLLGQCGGNAMQ